ncbi:MAG: DNA-binding protein [Oscillospiraceae bacterium]|nr:DNA-binding protein [Oscillospiraceae bacterium]
MEYRRFNNRMVIRFDLGEEILTGIRQAVLQEGIKLAQVSAIGATDRFTVGVYDVEKQVYHQNTYTGPHEIVSLSGSVNTMNGEYYAHIHMSAGNSDNIVYGGHLNEAFVCPTCEMFLDIIDGTVDREKDPKTGINIFKFEE